MVEGFLKNTSKILLDMKSLNFAYSNMFDETDVNCQHYLKQSLLENIPDIQFIRPPARNQSEWICSSHGQSKAVENSFQNTNNNYQNIFQVAKNVSREILGEEKWQFNGSYNGFKVPRLLDVLHWILSGPRKGTEKRTQINEIEKLVNILSELVMNMIKSNHHLQYYSHQSNDRAYNQMSETFLTVWLGFTVHKSTQSKDLVELMSDLDLCIPYDKIIKIENSIASSVTQRINENNSVHSI